MKHRHKVMTMAAAIAELSVAGTAQAASVKEVSRSSELRSSAGIYVREPVYRMLDGTSFEMFRLLGKGRSIKDIAFYYSIPSSEVLLRLDLIRKQTGCKTRADLTRKASAWIKLHEPA